MSLRPLHDWVLVDLEKSPTEHESAGGILLPHPELVRKGTVASVGPGRLYVDGVYQPCEVQLGARVAFLSAALDTKQGHQLATTLGTNQALIRETDILFVIEEGDPRLEK